jgi:hypothetical protein
MYEAKRIFLYEGKMYAEGDTINPKQKDIAQLEANGLIGSQTVTKVEKPKRTKKVADPTREVK